MTRCTGEQTEPPITNTVRWSRQGAYIDREKMAQPILGQWKVANQNKVNNSCNFKKDIVDTGGTDQRTAQRRILSNSETSGKGCREDNLR